MHKDFTSKKGIHAIAIFELVKGLLGLSVGVSLLLLLHRDLRTVAETILEFLHIDPMGQFANFLVDKASKINESNILIFVGLAFLYAIVRGIEAYGLWKLRAWAEWFAIISGSIYVPVEIYELLQKATFTRFAILAGNILIVLYLIYVRWESNYQKTHADEEIDHVAE